MNFLQFYVRFGNKELDTKFNLEVDAIAHQKKIPMTLEEAILQIVKEEAEEEGIEKGLEQGLVIGRLERDTAIVRNLIHETDFSTEQIARLAGVSNEFVEEIRQNH